MDGRMDGWTDGRTDGRMDGYFLQCISYTIILRSFSTDNDQIKCSKTWFNLKLP